MSPEFVYSIAIAAGCCIKWDIERPGYLLEGEPFPEFEMDHGALVGRQFPQGNREGLTQGCFVRCHSWGEYLKRLLPEFSSATLNDGRMADKIQGKVVGQAQQESARLPHALQHFRSARHTHKNLLQQVARIAFVARQIQEEPKQRLGMLIVQGFQIQGRQHLHI